MAWSSDASSIAGKQHCWSRSSRLEQHLLELEAAAGESSIPVHPVSTSELSSLLSSLDPLAAGWATTSRFAAKAGETLLVPGPTGGLARVLLGLGNAALDPASAAASAAAAATAAASAGGAAPAAPSAAPSLPELWAFSPLAKLPAGTYHLAPAAGASLSADVANRAAVGFLLGHYSFDRYKPAVSKRASGDGGQQPAAAAAAADAGSGAPAAAAAGPEPEGKAKLVWPAGCNRTHVLALVRAYALCRDLITTPAEDMGPQHLAAEAAALAEAHGAQYSLIQGEELLEANYPAIHTVGRASHRPPSLAMFEWAPPGLAAGDAAALPLLALVGKGVCFDTGGLDLKPAASMKNMKKDMGGAALVLALAHVVMAAGLRCRLLVMVPTVENAVSANSYRPLDVLATRAGISVENGNTDAEGRLILSDCLFEAASRGPDLLIDAATLTGAARAALGADLPAVFASCDETWRTLEAAAQEEADPLWRLPLHAPYRKQLDSKVAQLSSTGSDGLGGAIIAALFLQEFAKAAPRWVHIDTSAFVSGGAVGPGRPEGGEAQALRALWRMLSERYGSGTA